MHALVHSSSRPMLPSSCSGRWCVLLTVSFGSLLIPFWTDVEDDDYETEDNQFDENQPTTSSVHSCFLLCDTSSHSLLRSDPLKLSESHPRHHCHSNVFLVTRPRTASLPCAHIVASLMTTSISTLLLMPGSLWTLTAL